MVELLKQDWILHCKIFLIALPYIVVIVVGLIIWNYLAERKYDRKYKKR